MHTTRSTPQHHTCAAHRSHSHSHRLAAPLQPTLVLAAALAAALVLVTCPAQAAAPATDQVYRSMQAPYPPVNVFDNSATAWHSFYSNATDTYGLQAHTVNMTAAPITKTSASDERRCWFLDCIRAS